ncbi:MAG: flagellar basal body rod protein FlgB [Candidatus Fervidibacter sp.]|uniref:flagellar basal body rod protein FlgB n=1 Tax=Candidatus Fervidibacter sp. TaxID=3100871 RepID=UPI00404A6B62
MALFGLEKALTILNRRAQVLAQNLANANTPNYIRRDLPFHSLLKKALDKNSNPPTTIQFDLSTPVRADGNNTSPERELSELSKTALLYRTTLQLVAKEIAQLRSAIFEGRR